MDIPDDLVALARQRRLIPFVGAGFSAALDLPSWESMLRDLCDKTEGSLSYDALAKATGGDFLQIAEYLYLKCDRRIGPIRHQLERSLGVHRNPLLSGPHIELVNLGSSQIYTTNYDDLIESTYRQLGVPVTPVVLPKDVALAATDKTQVVKYHGDLAHEHTLVLTESAYYKRLDFESPMDLKFRSDILGKSVLFMGYSFRDVNIRIIWFKLMQMMRDIPESDRRPSYILRIDPNPALDELNAAVGLRTIVLNPDGRSLSDADRTGLMGEFLLNLAEAASPDGLIPGTTRKTFVSSALIDRAKRMQGRWGSPDILKGLSVRHRGLISLSGGPLRRLLSGEVPGPLKEAWHAQLHEIAPLIELASFDDLLAVLSLMQPSTETTDYVIDLLLQPGDTDLRKWRVELLEREVFWPGVWAHGPSPEKASTILTRLRDETRFSKSEADEDIVFVADLAQRLVKGQLFETVSDEDQRRGEKLLSDAANIYSEIANLMPDAESAPPVRELLDEVHARMEALPQAEEPPEAAIAAPDFTWVDDDS
ncbi:hypothetical protein GCM10027053_44740 [Intrasporangium mesophilum]